MNIFILTLILLLLSGCGSVKPRMNVYVPSKQNIVEEVVPKEELFEDDGWDN